ncbi:MAG: hypothetical protein CR971_02740 [candidate division SR1 bacterium]|nr:MAG: hypothetical protein CR971_02740 [candidate division SR1 bacterium]
MGESINKLFQAHVINKEEDASKKALNNVLSSKYGKIFHKELELFCKNINLNEKEIPTMETWGKLFVETQTGTNYSTERMLKFLSNQLHQINYSDITEEEKIDLFLKKIIGNENISFLEKYIKENKLDELEYTKSWYNFLNNADKKLVFPIIAGGMGGMGMFKFLTQSGIDNIQNLHSYNDILSIPGIDNVIQAIITMSVLVIIKKSLKRRIENNSH